MGNIVAIVGMCGSGKSVVTEVFTERGWKSVYFGGVTMRIIAEEGLEKTPENEKIIREGLRAKYGMAAYAVKLEDEIRELSKEHDVVLDGLYSWSEYKYLSEKIGGIVLLAIVTDSGDRYDRLAVREVRPFTYEQSMARDIAEIENLEKGGPIAFAHKYIHNNGDIEKLRAKTVEFIESL